MICRAAAIVFSALYAAALALLAVGTFGLFGAQRDPLSGVYVVLLGLPWVRFADAAPAAVAPWLAALSPALNLAILWGACRLAGRMRGARRGAAR